MVSDEHYTDAGIIDPNITNGLLNTSLYAEYGLSNRVTGILYLPFFSRNFINNQISGTTGELLKSGEAINSIGDTEVALKVGLSKPGSRFPLSASLRLGLPLGNDAGGTENNLQTGDGEFNQMFQIDAGTSLGSSDLPLYASAYAAFNNRTRDFSDEVRFGLELGAAFANQKLWVISRLQAIRSLKNGKLASEVTSTSIFANNAEVLSLGGELNFYMTDQVGLSAGLSYPLSGRIVLAAPAYSVGVFFDMQ